MDSNNTENNTKTDDLAELLDSALKDFGKSKTSDEELDELMDGLDREATQKAAKNFQAMLEGMVTAIDHEQEQQAPSGTEEDAKFVDGLRELMKRSGELANAPDEKGYLEALSNLEPNPMVDELMGMLAQTLLSKDVMLPVIKEVCDKYEPYLEENREKLDADTLERYTEQHKLFVVLRGLYETEAQEGEDPEKRATVIGQHWLNLQKYGQPPAEVAGALPPGWETDPDTGMPKLGSAEAASESCAIM
ncbi:PRX-19 protein [Aphelenchoides avenae]|nr:PRX-19 protein [Aphelenchus avenae]